MMEESDRIQLNAAATAVAVVVKTVENLEVRFSEMYKRLYNGGTGDITKILERIDIVEKGRDRADGVKMAFGLVATACAVFLAILQIYNLIHGKTP